MKKFTIKFLGCLVLALVIDVAVIYAIDVDLARGDYIAAVENHRIYSTKIDGCIFDSVCQKYNDLLKEQI